MSTDASSPRRYRTAAEVNTAGIDALIRALGVADAARFLQQYGPGLGDYTAERDALLKDLGMDDVLQLVKQHERSKE